MDLGAASDEDAALSQVFACLQHAAERDPYPSWRDRDNQLAALERLLRENADAFVAAVDQDFGHRSAHETQLLELFPSLEAVKHLNITRHRLAGLAIESRLVPNRLNR